MKIIFVLALLIFSSAQLRAATNAAPGFDAAGIWPVLGDGDDKPATVRALQYLLRARGFAVAVDGRYGNQTWSFVQTFQLRHHIEAKISSDMGMTDALTWEYLTSDLKHGSRGWQVRALQSLLRARGYQVALDGQLGLQTERAVRRFQNQRNLLQGVIEPGTVERFTWCELVGGHAYMGGAG